MSNGELVKFKIEAFQKEDYSGSPVDTFEVMFNPNNYIQKFEVNYTDAQGAGDTASRQTFNNIKPQEYNFEFLLDGTGTIADKVNVNDKIKHFFKVTGKNDGDIHRPPYLKIVWGSLLVCCVLKSAEVAYSLFDSGGTPLRARIRAIFAEGVEDKLRVAETGNSSPDLSHYRTVREGDSLPLMVENIYGNASYYLQIAKINGLKNFRQLEVGQQLWFPPVKNPKA